MKLSGDFTNTGGTVSGAQSLSINANTITNYAGRFTGGVIDLTTKNDLNVIGGSIEAGDKLKLDIGRDLNLITTMASASSSTGTVGTGKGAYSVDLASQTIDRMAGVYVSNPGGTMAITVGHDASLVAAQVVG